MRTSNKPCGFTLIELLVVIMIIAMLAAALLPQITKAREHGFASRCKTNLRNLAQASLNLSAHEGYGGMPYAGGHEVHNLFTHEWVERKGWVNWLPEPGQTPDWPNRVPQLPKMEPPTWYGPKAALAIKEGELWEFINQEISSYICPKFKKRTICGRSDGVRSYAMNGFFGFDGDVAREQEDPRSMRFWYRETIVVLREDASRLLLFGEMCPQQNYLGRPAVAVSQHWANHNVNDANYDNDDAVACDSVLASVGPQTYGDPDTLPYESIGYLHPMNGEYFGHVVFVDGHVEAFTVMKNSSGTSITNNITHRLCSGDY